MRDFKKPNLILSKCLEYCNCRYNGDKIPDKFVRKLEKHVNYIKVCPEVEIGLGVPRNSIRLIKKDGEYRLVDSMTGEDHTKKMDNYIEELSSKLNEQKIEGFIAKTRSPSCASHDSKVYAKAGKVPGLGEKRAGYFTKNLLVEFPSLVIENEGRLKNFKLRENFLIKIFMLADLRNVIEGGKIKELIDFHSNNKYLIMSYNQTGLNKLGRIIAAHGKDKVEETMINYRKQLLESLNVIPDVGKRVNMLQHIFGYVSSDIGKEEREYFLKNLDDFKNDKVPFSVPLALLRSWVIRFKVEYLIPQTIFKPYPEGLIDLSDSGNGRL
ncbi:MAG: YbgA family protein [Bacillota bacterium]